jgi:hypothetical protein
MFKFETIMELFCILKIKNNLKKHWTYDIGWGMVEAMHNIILSSIVIVVQGVIFLGECRSSHYSGQLTMFVSR